MPTTAKGPQLYQNESIWFHEDEPDCPYSVEMRLDYVNPENPKCPLSRFVGNKCAVKRLSRAAFAAWSRYNHACADQSLAIIGPASTGKTTLAKLFAKTVDLPFVSIQPRAIHKVEDIFNEISEVCARTSVTDHGESTLKLIPMDYMNEKTGRRMGHTKYYILPPMVVFIDEVHSMRDNVVQGLLKATEADDREMVTESGIIANTANVCWIIATTERGLLFKPFDSRFEKIELRLYSKKEVSLIVGLNNPDWDTSNCDLVAKYCSHVPRESLRFAREMRTEFEMQNGKANWEKVAATIAEDRGIDPYGMTYQRLQVLKFLGNKTVSQPQMATFIGVEIEELKKYTMPALLATTPDQEMSLVMVTPKGYCITPAGLKELDKRKISNRGNEAMTQDMQQFFGVGLR